MRKILTLLLFAIFLTNTTFSGFSVANAEQEVAIEEIDESFKQLLSPYVVLSSYTKQYALLPEAKKVLTKKQWTKAKSIITTTNRELLAIKDELEVSPDNTSVLKAVDSAKKPNQMMTMAISKAKSFDYEFTWWGLQMYWSHAFVVKLRNNLSLYGAGVAGFNAALSATLSAFAITPPAWLYHFGLLHVRSN